MPHLSPQTLTEAEQRALLRVAASHPRDHLLFSLALGTGLRLAEIVGLDVGDVFFPDGAPRGRVRLRREIAKRHRAGEHGPASVSFQGAGARPRPGAAAARWPPRLPPDDCRGTWRPEGSQGSPATGGKAAAGPPPGLSRPPTSHSLHPDGV